MFKILKVLVKILSLIVIIPMIILGFIWQLLCFGLKIGYQEADKFTDS